MFRQYFYPMLTAVIASTLLLMQTAQAAPVAVVNGDPISQKTYEQYLKYRTGGQKDKATSVNREALINEMVNRKLLLQEAKKAKLHKDSEVRYRIEQQKTDILIQALLQKQAKKNPVSEKELRKEYDSKVGNANLKEYKARHILLKSEADAKSVIAELDSGSNFAELAKSKSTGPTAKNGGDLGWFKPNQMVPPFAQAISEMKKGSYTKKPVKTQFGWHVIKLEDERKLTPPKFEEVKEQIRSIKTNQKIQQYVIKLRKKAKVDIK